MRAVVATSLVAGLVLTGPAAAQTGGYAASPWWMREPVIASIGYVRTEVEANRAFVNASFQVVDANPARATEKAAAQIRDLGAALQRIGGDRIRVQTTFSTVPLYEQYRDRDGTLIDNQRADKIDRYQVNANVSIEVRDTTLLQRVYGVVIAAKPSSTDPVVFRLEPTNETKSWLYNEAVKDAAQRARAAAEAAGSRIGPVKAIDPTGRLCQTDVLALTQSTAPDGYLPTEVTVTGSRVVRQDFEAISPVTSAGAPPPPVPGAALEAAAEAMQLTLQPPLQPLTAKACIIYALG